jgi:hypothetical protein
MEETNKPVKENETKKKSSLPKNIMDKKDKDDRHEEFPELIIHEADGTSYKPGEKKSIADAKIGDKLPEK